VLQIARYRIVNELRRRSRRPIAAAGDPGGELEALADTSPEPSEAAWREYRSSVLQSAFAALPPNQRTALGLAFFEELTHEQVASVLGVALGTAKSRIRSGLHQLRGKIGYLVAAVAIVATLGAVMAREVSEQARVARQERAIALLTSSDTQVLRATAQPGAPAEAHATYRGQAGSPMAILTISYMPPLPAGRVYQAWARYGTRWVSIGSLTPDANGSGRLIAEDPAFSTLPSGLEVTVEPEGGSPAPTTPPLVLLPGS
jgi:RNA polymerase sigma-70 factor (ECF subfamily)